MKTYGGVEINLSTLLTLHLKDVEGLFQVPSALPQGELPPVPIV
jgi:hypothetical protein